MKRWIRIRVVVGWAVIVGMVVLGQWRVMRVWGERTELGWRSEGVEIARTLPEDQWVLPAGQRWAIAVDTNSWRGIDYLLPHFERVSTVRSLRVPWLWLLPSLWVVTWVVWRRGRRRVVGAFEVEELEVKSSEAKCQRPPYT